jgi:lipopolysaccharide export system protein LptA
MRIAALCVALFFSVATSPVGAEQKKQSSPAPASSPAAKKPDKKASPQPQGSPGISKLLGDSSTNPNEPTTTEIYSDEAFFDSNKSMGIFSGHVKVVDPRFNLQSDKLTVFISKSQANQAGQPGQSPAPSPAAGQTGQASEAPQSGQGQGLEKAIAEGNVGVVRDRPDPNGGPPTRAVGRADIATYVAKTGDVELKGTPRVQQGENTHVATSPDTVMVINQNGQLTTHGPSRTDIRQQPKDDDQAGGASPAGDKKDDKKGDNKGKKDEKSGDKSNKADKQKSSPKASPSPSPKA